MTGLCKNEQIKQIYGTPTLQKVREFEKTLRRCGRYTSHLRFSLQCKHSDVIPKDIRIDAPRHSSEGRSIILKAERALLNLRVSENVRMRDYFRLQRDRICADLERKISPELHQEIVQKNKAREQKELEIYSTRQKEKYLTLKYGKHFAKRHQHYRKQDGRQQDWRQQVERQQDERQQSRRQQIDRQQNWRDQTQQHTTTTVHTNTNNRATDVATPTDRTPNNRTTEITRPTPANLLPEGEQQQPGRDAIREKWVKNLSSRELTQPEVSILSKGGNFAIAPKEIPVDDYIIATEAACRKISNKGQKAALRAEITEILKNQPDPVSNLTREEKVALRDLQDDDTIMILQADKGKCLVVMDKQVYIERMEEKLKDETTYKAIEKDPTMEIKDALCKQLKTIKEEGQLSEAQYRRMLPTQTQIPRMYGHPKIHKPGNPLREIVDGSGGVVKQVDKFISNVIKHYVGDNEYYVKNSAHFVEQMKEVKVGADEEMVSYDVEALYPSVPQSEAITIISNRLHNDENLAEKTKVSANNMVKLLKICVQKTYFVFNKKLYQQINGLAIGASTSGFAANLFMEELEEKALRSFTNPPALWKRYVDDTFTILKRTDTEQFLQHLNNQHPRIKFTTETQEDNKLPFLDTLAHIEQDGTLTFTIYRKKTHTDQYLDFTSNHHIKQKTGIIQTFKNRIETIVTKEEEKRTEEKHVKKALQRCGHPNWVLNRSNKKRAERKHEEDMVGRVSLPYVKHLSEKVARTFKKYQIQTLHRPTTTVKNLLCSKKKDAVHHLDQAGVIYQVECKKHNVSYVGETERALKARAYDHRVVSHKDARISHSLKKEGEDTRVVQAASTRPRRNVERIDYKKLNSGEDQPLTPGSTPVSAHGAAEDHSKNDMEIKIIARENDWWRRGVKEALKIRELDPSLNEDEGRFHISPIYQLLDEKRTYTVRPRKITNPEQATAIATVNSEQGIQLETSKDNNNNLPQEDGRSMTVETC